jgi:ketosteroid isomerase-like protein
MAGDWQAGRRPPRSVSPASRNRAGRTRRFGQSFPINHQREERMTFTRTVMGIACILFGTAASAQQVDPDAGGELFQKLQSEFAQAYNRKDVAGMAAFFSENGVRITPAGIFRGRDAIGREMQRVIDMGLHDYSVRRIVSRMQGNMVFNAGEWQAGLGDQKLRGYYSALLVREGDEVKILEETVNVAAP